MRLIDADEFYDRVYNDTDICAEMEVEGLTALKKYLDLQPTAYDIDKVVEELKEWTFNTDLNIGDGTIMNHDLIVSKNAIEIVKNCGVADEVCEWESDYKFSSDKYKRITGCGYEFYDLHHALPFKYCPYCGKKIKVVE